MTCRFCNKVFQSVQARKNHERYIVHTLFRSNLLGYWGSSWWRQIHCHTCQKDCEKSDFEIQPSKILPQLVSSQHSGQVFKKLVEKAKPRDAPMILDPFLVSVTWLFSIETNARPGAVLSAWLPFLQCDLLVV